MSNVTASDKIRRTFVLQMIDYAAVVSYLRQRPRRKDHTSGGNGDAKIDRAAAPRPERAGLVG
jgi:hypothetical protein